MSPYPQRPPDRPVVAVINTSREAIELLQEVLEDEGFMVITAYVFDIKRGFLDIHTFFDDYQPKAVVYDIALPYIENWSYFRDHILGSQILPPTHFVITTTNKHVLEQLVGATQSIEFVGRPFDLNVIVQAVRQAVYGNKQVNRE